MINEKSLPAPQSFAAEREVLLAFLSSRMLVWIIAWFAAHFVRRGEFFIKPGYEIWNLLFRWDSGWYAIIAEEGYTYTPGVESRVAFFPLLPLCVRALSALTGTSTALAGFVVSNAALLGAAILLRRLVALDFSEPSRVPIRTVWLLLLCPVTFFHSALYSESLFLFLSVAAVFAARRHGWAMAGLAGGFLTATRANGVVILVPLLWEAFVETHSTRDASGGGILHSRWWLSLVPLGCMTYSAFLYFQFGDALAFAHVQAAWQRGLATPWWAVSYAFRSYEPAYAILFVGAEVIALVLLLIAVRVRLRISYLLYAGAMLLMLLSFTILESLPRYLSVVFPLPIALAAATARYEGAYLGTLAASAGMMGILLALYACGYWMT